MYRQRKLRPRARPRGAALLVAIVCVSIAVAVMYGLVRVAVQSQRQLGLQQRRVQAGWVLESAVDRAACHVSADGRYAGEQWSIPREELGGHYDAEVQIQVEAVDGQESLREVKVVVNYPVAPAQRVRQTRQFRMRLNP